MIHFSLFLFSIHFILSIQKVNGFVIIFGGVNREQTHFNDAIIFNSVDGKWMKAEQKGVNNVCFERIIKINI